MKQTSFLSNGVYTAVLTPIKNDSSVDFDLLIAHCNWLLKNGCTGIALLGTTGEANSFSFNERIEILEKVIAGGIPPKKLMVGTGCCSLPESIELTKHATEAGVGGVLVLPPFFYKQVADSGVFSYFNNLIKGVENEDLRIYLYHFPKMSGLPFSITLLQQLIDKFPQNIVGIKDSSGDFENMKKMVEAFPDFQVFAGTEKYLLDILEIGGAGCISATANATIQLVHKVFQSFSNNENAKAAQEYLTKVRVSFEGLPFSGALKSYMADLNDENRWLGIRPPNELISNQDLSNLNSKLAALDFHIV